MKIVIIGYGSIGKKHAKILSKIFKIKDLIICTKKKLKKFNTINNLNQIKKRPDYVVISSPTSKHFEQLKFIEKNFRGVKVLVEKPLFNKYKKLNIKKNKVFIGYNLRFHPIIKYIKKKIYNKKIIDIKVICNSYLPDWRKNRNYKKTSSAINKLGGGVILDLSHELDLARWLFGEISPKYVVSGKFSTLKIDTDDLLKLYGKINRANLSLDLNYYSRIPMREIIVDQTNSTFHADLIKNILHIKTANSEKVIKFPKFTMDNTYIEQHKAILKNKTKNLCDYNFAKKTMRLIDKIRK